MKNSSFPKDDPKYLWVIPADENGGQGTFERPFGRIATALSKARPGQIIVLKAGNYPGNINVETSGNFDKPLYIVADKGANVIISGACWYFYDVCDMIVSRLVFNESPLGSIAVLGLCERNRFENLSFKNCGDPHKASCTLFFGGSGAACNIVEFCNFERLQPPPDNRKKSPDNMTVGLMISEGDTLEGKPITDHVVRRNRFVNYDYGILIGAEDATMKQYGHIVAYNTIDNCRAEGIMVKCGDTQVRGNVITKCPNNSISVVTGEGSVVEDNRIVDSGLGIRVAGRGHTVSNNCLIRCGQEAIRVVEKNGATGIASQNIIIEKNTCADWSNYSPSAMPGITIEAASCIIIKKNMFWGIGEPYRFAGAEISKEMHLISDNISAGGCATPDGVIAGQLEFGSKEQDNYENNTGYGAAGWMCRPEPFDPDKEILEEPACGHLGMSDESQEIEKDDELEDEMENDGALLKSLFFDKDKFPQ
jgi:hypothetical protein